MKLELNLADLERLIGGNTEIEVSLRKHIVQEFAGRHLVEVASTASYNAALAAVKELVNKTAEDLFDVSNLATTHLWPLVGQRLKTIIEELVKEHAQKAVDEALLKVIQYQKRYWAGEIEKEVRKAMDSQIEKEIEEGIRKRLELAKNIIPPTP